MIEDITDSSNIIVMNTNGDQVEIKESDINIIITQTNYTKEEARSKLIELNDPILVIKEYMNPNLNKNNKEKEIKSLNQEIYSQIREEFYNVKLNAIKY
uniref:Uncharacterized protein n=1 Tax=Nucleocytoviricota sp. TaxID=2809609 RepID=A0A9E8G4T0_9VIRU|nr:hypothetical protein [Nucleocytoviricota sp.]UZT29081.1 hypothetical protein [Nucleocytoviricota sp.]